MKTITTFLVAALLLLVSLLFLGYAFHSFNLSTQEYATLDGQMVYDFQNTFITVGVLQIIIFIALFGLAVKTFHLYLKLYSLYQERRRDNSIIDSVDEARYKELYDELYKVKDSKSKMKIVKDFFMPERANNTVDKLMESLGFTARQGK